MARLLPNCGDRCACFVIVHRDQGRILQSTEHTRPPMWPWLHFQRGANHASPMVHNAQAHAVLLSTYGGKTHPIIVDDQDQPPLAMSPG